MKSKSIKYQVLSIRYFLFLLFFCLLLNTNYLLPVSAQDSTSSSKVATASASPSTLTEKIEALKKEIASKAASFKNEVNRKLENKAWAGIIAEKTDTTLTIQTKKGSKNVVFNEFTVYENNSSLKTKKRVFNLENLANDDYIIALGDVDDKNAISAKKIIKLDTPKDVIKQFFWGQISKLNGNILTIKNSTSEETELLSTSSTSFSLGSEEASVSDVKLEKFIAGWGILPDGSKRISARFIYVLTRGGKIKPQSATPSATTKN